MRFAVLAVALAVAAAPAAADDALSAPRAFTKTLTVTSAANVAAVYSSTFQHEIADCTNTTAGAAVHVVEEAATDLTNAGPAHCDTCAAPASFPVGKAWLRAASTTATVRCVFYDRAVPGIVGKAGGGGLRGSGADHEVAFFSSSSGGLDGDPSLMHYEGAGTLRSELDLYKAGLGGWVFYSNGTDGSAQIRNYGGSAENFRLSAPTGSTMRISTGNGDPAFDFDNSGLKPIYSSGTQSLGANAPGSRWLDLYLSGRALHGDGGSAAPSVSFTNKTTVGLYYGSDTLVVDGVDGPNTGNVTVIAGDVLQMAAGTAWNLTDGNGTTFIDGVEATGALEVGGTTVKIALAGPDWLFDDDGFHAPQKTSGTPKVIQHPSIINAAPTRPACSTSANAADIVYVDDTDDAEAGQDCVCNAQAGGAYSWRYASSPTTACAGTGSLFEEQLEAWTFPARSSSPALNGVFADVVGVAHDVADNVDALWFLFCASLAGAATVVVADRVRRFSWTA